MNTIQIQTQGKRNGKYIHICHTQKHTKKNKRENPWFEEAESRINKRILGFTGSPHLKSHRTKSKKQAITAFDVTIINDSGIDPTEKASVGIGKGQVRLSIKRTNRKTKQSKTLQRTPLF